MPALAAFVRNVDALNRAIGRSAAWLILATVLICAAVALGRYLFGFGRIWLQELYVVTAALAFMLVAPYAYAADQHVRIEILSDRLSRRAQAAVEIAGCVLFLIPWLVLIAWSSLPFVQLAWLVREPSSQPGGLPGIYLVKSAIPLFAALMALQALAAIGRRVLVLAGREPPGGAAPPPGAAA